MHIMCEWQHLKMLKHAGRGHTCSGAMGMQPGELAVICPACPHLGINILLDSENCPDDVK